MKMTAEKRLRDTSVRYKMSCYHVFEEKIDFILSLRFVSIVCSPQTEFCADRKA